MERLAEATRRCPRVVGNPERRAFSLRAENRSRFPKNKELRRGAGPFRSLPRGSAPRESFHRRRPRHGEVSPFGSEIRRRCRAAGNAEASSELNLSLLRLVSHLSRDRGDAAAVWERRPGNVPQRLRRFDITSSADRVLSTRLQRTSQI